MRSFRAEKLSAFVHALLAVDNSAYSIYEEIKERYSDWRIKLFKKGDSANNKSDLEFIRDTNKRYFNHLDDTIGGDFVRLEKRSNDKEMTFVCRLEMKYLYDEYSKNGWDQIWKIVETNTFEADNSTLILDNIRDYEKINNRLIARPLNYDENKDKLDGMVYRKVGDFVIALYIRISESTKGLVSVGMPKSIVDTWSISVDEAIDRALENSSILYPPKISRAIVNVDKIGIGVVYLPVNTDDNDLFSCYPLVCVCPNSPNGAVSFFYPGMCEELVKILAGEDFYVVFTAKSEFHLHRCKDNDPSSLKEALKDSNEHFPTDVLSHEIFKYDVAAKKLVTLNDF